jgi:DNA-binding GntR family transcriptional regulator
MDELRSWLADAEAGAARHREHEAVVEAVALGDPSAARAGAEDHVSRLFDAVKALHRDTRSRRST